MAAHHSYRFYWLLTILVVSWKKLTAHCFQCSRSTSHPHLIRRTPSCLSAKLKDRQQESEKSNPKRKSSFTVNRLDMITQLNYARDGHALLRQFLDPRVVTELERELLKYSHEHELSAWQQKVDVARAGSSSQFEVGSSISECQEQLRNALGEGRPPPFLQYFNVWRSNKSVFSLAYRLAESASILLDVPSVRLYQDALFWKRKGRDGVTPWHIDATASPFDTPHFLTFWIPLQEVKDSGLVFCSKTHADYSLPYWYPYSDETKLDDESPWNNLEDRYAGNSVVDYMPLRVGDVTVHSGWTLHCADPVAASRDRLALAISFVDARAPIRSHCVAKGGSTNDGDSEDLWSYKDWIHDVPTGSFHWDHERVPILWPRKRHITATNRKVSKI